MISSLTQSQIDLDLAVNAPFIKGQTNKVKNCWHCCSDGKSTDGMFLDTEDFRHGMNRIYTVSKKFRIRILAFALMDTHVHFIIYGTEQECLAFLHEYIRLTSMYMNGKYGSIKKFLELGVSCIEITDDLYLKTSICYVLRNPFAAGLPFLFLDYPWSSASLYFRLQDNWTSPQWQAVPGEATDFTFREYRAKIKSRVKEDRSIQMIGNLIHPLEYTDNKTVEKIFRTPRAFFAFACQNKEEEMDMKFGVFSRLSMTISELRENRRLISRELFGTEELRQLGFEQRLKLAKTLNRRYHSSPEQILRSCGLKIAECKHLL